MLHGKLKSEKKSVKSELGDVCYNRSSFNPITSLPMEYLLPALLQGEEMGHYNKSTFPGGFSTGGWPQHC